MASPTKKSKIRRSMKKAAEGMWRKNKTRRDGSTKPSLALNKPNANEVAQHAK